jgi:hypothetical protein
MSKLKDNCPHFLWMLWMLHRLLVHVGFYGCYEKIVTKKYKYLVGCYGTCWFLWMLWYMLVSMVHVGVN